MTGTKTRERTVRSVLLVACVTTLAVPFTLARTRLGGADRIPLPAVPANLQVPPQSKAVLVGRAQGTQNYVCTPAGGGFTWTLFTPQATLFDDRGRQLLTHAFSPNPDEAGLVRAAWEDSRDTSIVWGRVSQSSSDPQFVRHGAIPWLLVERVGSEKGPTGGDKVVGVTHIQRVHTVGGAAPSIGCGLPTDIGKQAFVPYRADYYFYESVGRHAGAGH